jgi:hypothetical protein
VSETTNIPEAIERLKLSQSAYQNQETREREDLEFQIPDKQWTSENVRERPLMALKSDHARD